MSAVAVIRPGAALAGGTGTAAQLVPFQIAANTCRAPSTKLITRSAVEGLEAPLMVWIRVPMLAPFVSALKPIRRRTLRFAAEPLSLSEPLREDGDAELGDVVEDRSAESPFEVAATALLPEEISRLLAPLDEREREILKLRFGLDRGEPRTLEEVGEHFNLTRERIRQIEARAMSKLRHPSSDTGARDLLAV